MSSNYTDWATKTPDSKSKTRDLKGALAILLGALLAVVGAGISSVPADAASLQSQPQIDSVNPAQGTTAGGTSVELVGKHFFEGLTVTFDGTAATGVVINSEESVTVVTPAHAAGVVEVKLTNFVSGKFATSSFEYVTPMGPSTDTSLSVFTVDATPVADGDTVYLSEGTTSVTVVATPTDPMADAVIAGDTGLVAGPNTLTVTVTAEDPMVTQVYTVTLWVTSAADASLKVFTVDGTPVDDGDTVYLDTGTTAVTVVATPTNPAATVDIDGDTGLDEGQNILTVTVTAEDGVTTMVYTVSLWVTFDADTSLKLFTIDGTPVEDGDFLSAPFGTDEVTVIALAANPSATVDIDGDTGLVAGLNIVTVTVTAADGVTTETYTVTIGVGNDDTGLSTLTVNAVAVSDGDVVNLAAGTPSVTVVATPFDPAATVDIVGDTGLSTGSNVLVVTVTAEDGVTTEVWTINLIVAAAPVIITGAGVTGFASTVPSAPTNVVAFNGNNQVTLTWTTPATNGGSPITNYQVEYYGDNGTNWVVFVRPASTLTSTTVSGLRNGNTYIFRVIAQNANGSSLPSAPSAAITPVLELVDLGGATFFRNWTTKIAGSSIKIYARNVVGAGKVQFFANGKEIAWVRAVDLTDPKVSVAAGRNYLVRTVTLKPGKNVFEIYRNGLRTWRAAYTLR